jgi:hypothetical protein
MVGVIAFCCDCCDGEWPAACDARVHTHCSKVIVVKLLAGVSQTAGHMNKHGATSAACNRFSKMRDRGKHLKLWPERSRAGEAGSNKLLMSPPKLIECLWKMHVYFTASYLLLPFSRDSGPPLLRV